MMMNKIAMEIEKMNTADEMMTEALIAMDEHDWQAAMDIANHLAVISGSVEQRLAAQHIANLANTVMLMHDEDTKAMAIRNVDTLLRLAYNI